MFAILQLAQLREEGNILVFFVLFYSSLSIYVFCVWRSLKLHSSQKGFSPYSDVLFVYLALGDPSCGGGAIFRWGTRTRIPPSPASKTREHVRNDFGKGFLVCILSFSESFEFRIRRTDHLKIVSAKGQVGGKIIRRSDSWSSIPIRC